MNLAFSLVATWRGGLFLFCVFLGLRRPPQVDAFEQTFSPGFDVNQDRFLDQVELLSASIQVVGEDEVGRHARLKDVLFFYDIDGDNRLSMKEFNAWASNDWVTKFQIIDNNRNGKLSENEVLAYIKADFGLSGVRAQPRLHGFFSTFDKDRDGHITLCDVSDCDATLEARRKRRRSVTSSFVDFGFAAKQSKSKQSKKQKKKRKESLFKDTNPVSPQCKYAPSKVGDDKKLSKLRRDFQKQGWVLDEHFLPQHDAEKVYDALHQRQERLWIFSSHSGLRKAEGSLVVSFIDRCVQGY